MTVARRGETESGATAPTADQEDRGVMTQEEWTALPNQDKRQLIINTWRGRVFDPDARLYWKRAGKAPRWIGYERGDIAMIKDGPWRTFFKNLLSMAQYMGIVEDNHE